MAPTIHIVLFKYRSSIPWTTLESHFRDFQALKSTCLKNGKPYIVSMRMGKNTSWENFSKSMTHCIIIEFASDEDRDHYLLRDSVHHDFSAKAGPLIQDSVVVDMQDGKLFADASPSDTSRSSSEYAGKCHCERIHWTVDLSTAAPQHILCHCRTCQLLSGSPYSCNAIVPQSHLRITHGQPSVYSYTGASGKPVLCYHCGNCTSHIYHHQMSNPDQVIVRTLLLEGGNKMGVGGEIFTEGALGWVRSLRDALPES